MEEPRSSDTLRKSSIGGSVLAAIGASLCCIGPLLAVILGAGGFAAASTLAKWRPVFLGVTVVFLGIAWYLTYRKTESCTINGACAEKPGNKWSKVVLWFATAFVLVAAAFPHVASILVPAQGGSAIVATGGNETLNVRVPSMDCLSCAANIQRKLLALNGVAQAEVVYKTKEAVVSYDPSRVSSETIISTIDETGFKAEKLMEKSQKPQK